MDIQTNADARIEVTVGGTLFKTLFFIKKDQFNAIFLHYTRIAAFFLKIIVFDVINSGYIR